MKTDLLNGDLMDDFSSFTDDYSNITANRCGRIKSRYEKAVTKGKDNKAARKLAKLLKKCENLIEMPINKTEQAAQAEALEKEAGVADSITTDIPTAEETPNKDVVEKAGVVPDDTPPPENKILGMKKKVAVPVIMVSGLAVATGAFFLIRKMVKK